jgi:hypothetical protein
MAFTKVPPWHEKKNFDAHRHKCDAGAFQEYGNRILSAKFSEQLQLNRKG